MVKRIDSLTEEQKAQMKPWADKWIEIGLKTGKADDERFISGVKACYECANLEHPKAIVKVPNPLVGALAAPIASYLLSNFKSLDSAIRAAVGFIVGSTVGSAVDSAVDSAVNSAVGAAVDSAVDETTNSTVHFVVSSAVNSALGSTVDSAVNSAVNSAVSSTVRSAAHSAVGSAVHSVVNSDVNWAINSDVDSAVNSAVNSAVDSAVNSTVHFAVNSAVSSTVRSAVGSAVHSVVNSDVNWTTNSTVHFAVNSAVNSAVGAAVDSAVGSAAHSDVNWAINSDVDSAIRAAVRSAVNSAVSSTAHLAISEIIKKLNLTSDELKRHVRKNWSAYIGGQFWVGGWWGGPAYVSFYTDVCGLELDTKTAKAAKAYRDTCESACWWWPYNDFVMYCERPKHILKNDRGQLHSTEKAAMAWEGFEEYALDGVRLEKEIWEKIVNRTLKGKEILAIKNMEIRMVALKYSHPDEVLKSLNAKLLDSSAKGNDLYLITETFDEPAYFLRYACPSTGRVYMSGIPPEVGIDGDADAGMAWKHHLTKEEYLSIEAES